MVYIYIHWFTQMMKIIEPLRNGRFFLYLDKIKTMKKLFTLFIFFMLLSCGSDTPNACIMSEDFIKKELNFPKEASFPMLDCNTTDNGNGNYTVLRKISAKNAFGMDTEYIYKLELKFNGGIDVDANNWELKSIRSEEVK